jgi:ABC-type dipeptide/oligopeptide/nickel transport system permease component
MQGYGVYVLKRFAQFLLVVFIGISLTFFITHLTPIDPVEQMVAGMTAYGTERSPGGGHDAPCAAGTLRHRAGR